MLGSLNAFQATCGSPEVKNGHFGAFRLTDRTRTPDSGIASPRSGDGWNPLDEAVILVPTSSPRSQFFAKSLQKSAEGGKKGPKSVTNRPRAPDSGIPRPRSGDGWNRLFEAVILIPI